jgi:hypothetical protein
MLQVNWTGSGGMTFSVQASDVDAIELLHILQFVEQHTSGTNLEHRVTEPALSLIPVDLSNEALYEHNRTVINELRERIKTLEDGLSEESVCALEGIQK